MKRAVIAALLSLVSCGVEPSATEETREETASQMRSTGAVPAVTLPRCSTEAGGVCAGLQVGTVCNSGPALKFCEPDSRLPDGSIACLCESEL
ncbi:MAG TPA: hypothetical protein VHW23_13855 [Kofleriaceae bacterium]|jgi:hypothetical protein|nr:hypothetical protein [Kofleriaceae bacterium]